MNLCQEQDIGLEIPNSEEEEADWKAAVQFPCLVHLLLAKWVFCIASGISLDTLFW